MLFWLISAGLTAAVMGALLRPLWRGAENTTDRLENLRENNPEILDSAYGAAVYRDQLEEIDRDIERGLIEEAEAQSARVEISRRLLAIVEAKERLSISLATPLEKGAEVREKTGKWGRSSLHLKLASTFILLILPALSLTFYLSYGSPGLEGQPYAVRLTKPLEKDQLSSLIARVEMRLHTHPEDGKGWEVIAPVYLKSGRFADAAQAYENAIRLLGESAPRLMGFGEAVRLANNGIVTEPARRAFEKALKQDPSLIYAQMRIVESLEQEGKFSEALKIWQSLKERVGEKNRLYAPLEERIKSLQSKINQANERKNNSNAP